MTPVLKSSAVQRVRWLVVAGLFATGSAAGLISTNGPFVGVDWTEATEQLMHGLTSGFFDTKEGEEEDDCLSRNVGTLADNLISAIDEVITFVRILVAQPGAAPEDSPDAASSTSSPPLLPDVLNVTLLTPMPPTTISTTVTTSSWPRVSGVLANFTTSLSGVVAAQAQLTSTCMDAGLADDWLIAGANLRHPQFLGNELLINGAAITNDLNDAVEAFLEQRWEDSGRLLGHALRTIIVPDNHTVKVSAWPTPVQAELFFSGLLNGLLGGDEALVTASGSELKWSFRMDLCVSSFVGLLELIIMQIKAVVKRAQMVEVNRTHVFDPVSWEEDLSQVLLEIPIVLDKCGLDPLVFKMLTDAIDSGRHLNFSMRYDEIENEWTWVNVHDFLSSSTMYWEQHDYKNAGFFFGHALLGCVLQFNPQSKYAVDRRIDVRPAAEPQHSWHHYLGVAHVVPLTLLALLVALVLRVGRKLTRRYRAIEDAHDVALDEEDGLE